MATIASEGRDQNLSEAQPTAELCGLKFGMSADCDNCGGGWGQCSDCGDDCQTDCACRPSR